VVREKNEHEGLIMHRLMVHSIIESRRCDARIKVFFSIQLAHSSAKNLQLAGALSK
jgi:hypothetical protein